MPQTKKMKLVFLVPTALAFNNKPLQLNRQSAFLRPVDCVRYPVLEFRRKTPLNAQVMDSSDQALLLWVFAFASSHIGMSAIRSHLISSIGSAADLLNLVGNEEWRLPSWWPGDNTGGDRIFPDELTTGRQVYRAAYTIVSFITLGSAFWAYFSSSIVHAHSSLEMTSSVFLQIACLFAASLSFGAAIASLFNASPLGLMPSFEPIKALQDEGDFATTVSLRRDDALKFATRGLTRITRHPLILPVVPWGFATAYLAEGRLCDYILFGGLSLYAIAGCYAQDLRVLRDEGSVGTVFQTESRQKDTEDRKRLRAFFAETSFVPFKAIFDGRQNLNDVIMEAPWTQFIVGTLAGVLIELELIHLLEKSSIFQDV